MKGLFVNRFFKFLYRVLVGPVVQGAAMGFFTFLFFPHWPKTTSALVGFYVFLVTMGIEFSRELEKLRNELDSEENLKRG